jgi:hypothetical protein
MRHWHRNNGNQDRKERNQMAEEGKARTSKSSKLGFAKIAAALVALLLLGVLASGALADGDPFAARPLGPTERRQPRRSPTARK